MNPSFTGASLIFASTASTLQASSFDCGADRQRGCCFVVSLAGDSGSLISIGTVRRYSSYATSSPFSPIDTVPIFVSSLHRQYLPSHHGQTKKDQETTPTQGRTHTSRPHTNTLPTLTNPSTLFRLRPIRPIHTPIHQGR